MFSIDPLSILGVGYIVVFIACCIIYNVIVRVRGL